MDNIGKLFDADVRQIKSKFKIYLDGVDAPPIIFDDDNYVMDSDILEEAGSDDTNPLGNISSNELVITLHNENKIFSLNNVKSPYYNKLIPGIKVIAYHCIMDSEGKYQEVNMGTFYTTSWKSDTGNITASVTCNDKMYVLGDIILPTLLPDSYISVKEILTKVLDSVGLKPNEYDIQIYDDNKLEVFSYPVCKLKEFLQWFVTGYGCLIYIDRSDKLVIKDVLYTPENPVASLTDDNQILSLTVPQEILSLYTRIDLSYNRPQISDRRVLLDMRNINLVEGVNKLQNISFNHTPVVRLDSVCLDGGSLVTVTKIDYDSWNISLEISREKNNLDKPYDLTATGYTIDVTKQNLSTIEEKLQKRIGEHTLEVSSHIIQKQDTAIAFSNKLLNIVTRLDAYLEIICRGNSTICVGDTIVVQDTTNTISGKYIVYRNKFEHNGALQANMKLIKVVSD